FVDPLRGAIPTPPITPHPGRTLSIRFRARVVGALLLGSAALGACDSGTDPDAGLEVALAITPDTVRIGRPAEVAVTVTNLGSEDASIHMSGCERLVVTTVAGEVVGPGERVCTAELWVVVLAPGERIVLEDSWMGDGLRGGAGS